MTAQRELDRLKALSTIPIENRAAWLSGAADAEPFLISNATADYVVVYAAMPAAFILAVLAPTVDLTPTNKADLENLYLSVDSTWCIQRVSGGGEPRQIYLERPLASSRTRSLIDGEPIVTRRDFQGMSNHRAPVELNQRVIHALDLHWIAERNAFCQLDDRGDLIDVIWLYEIPDKTGWNSTTVVLFEAKRLAEYMAVTDQAMFRKFDFTRIPPESFSGWSMQNIKNFDSPDLFFTGVVMSGHASYINGGQVIRASITVEDLVAAWEAESTHQKEYETFKIHNFRHSSLIEVSAGPNGVQTYFDQGNMPFETSPAFFRAEVLNRFKADPDKYEMDFSSISCRNAWFLRSYDINNEGQVHVLICDLADLPIYEQRYWKLFNE